MSEKIPIHAVYTWIDATDGARLAQRGEWLDHYGISESDRRLPVALIGGEPRHTELYFSLHTLKVFAPWIEKIWIVTQRPQSPAFLNEFPRASIVHHDEIFEDRHHLPTFSSRAIEANLHRIPGLSEHFIYLNDDMFLGQPVAPEDFFMFRSGVHLPILRCIKRWKPVSHSARTLPLHLQYAEEMQTVVSKRDNAYVNSNRRVHRWLNDTFVRDPTRTNLNHQATPLTISLMKDAARAMNEEWDLMISCRFRHSDTMSPVPLAIFMAFYKGNAVVLPSSRDRLKGLWGSADSGDLMRQVLKEKPHLFCLNDIGPHLGEGTVRVYWRGLHKIIEEAYGSGSNQE
jgi:hypothetical protein